jgi:hypothetical protein
MPGRKRKYEDPAALTRAINAYFRKCDQSWEESKEHPPTVTGLALALGFTHRKHLYDFEKREQLIRERLAEAETDEEREALAADLETAQALTDAIQDARTRVEAWNHEHLYNNVTYKGAAWTLEHNFGFTPESTVKLGNAEDKPLQVKMSMDEKLDLIEKIRNGDI